MINEDKVLENIEVTQEESEHSPNIEAMTADSPDAQANATSQEEVSQPKPGDVSTESAEEMINTVVSMMQADISNLRQLLEEQTQKAEQHKKQYLQIAADFENYRKRTEKEKEEQEKKGKRQAITELLSVVDNFERARTQIKPNTEGETAIHKSYQGVYKNLVDGLKKLGVSAMRPEGEMFDPQYHEAMLREPTNEYPEGTVIEQLVRGYTLGDQVLRHALVKVATPLETSTTQENTIEQDSSE